MREFEQLQPQPGKSVADFCNEADTLAGQLGTADKPQSPLVLISKVLKGLQRARAAWKPCVRGDAKRTALHTVRDLSERGAMKDGLVLELCGLRQSLTERELENADKLAPRLFTYSPMAAAAAAPSADERVAKLEAELRRRDEWRWPACGTAWPPARQRARPRRVQPQRLPWASR